MDNITITETKIGATTYTVERVFIKDAKEDALQVIKRLMLQSARSSGQDKLSDNDQNPLAMCDVLWLYRRDTSKED